MRGVRLAALGAAEVVPPVVAVRVPVERGHDHAGVALRPREGLEVRLERFEGGIQPVLGRGQEGHLEVGSGRLSLLLLAGRARLALLLGLLAMGLLLGLWLLLLALLSASSILGLDGLKLLLSVLSLLVLMDS